MKKTVQIEKHMKKIFIRGILCAALLLTASAAVIFSSDIKAFADNDRIVVVKDGIELSFDTDPVIVNSRTLVPVRAIFESYGAEVYWDSGTEMVTAICGDTDIMLQIGNTEMVVNSDRIKLDAAPEIMGDRTMVPARAISEAFGSVVEWDDENRIVIIRSPVEYSPIMDGTEIVDNYRYENYDGLYNGVSVFDNDKRDYFGMELLSISELQGEEYADIINGMEEDLPDDVRVFCGIAPTAAEFYAMAAYRTNYLASISKIYNRLNSNVIPFNIERAMMERANEYIYFRTDHHWTQLGAYYAYREFCDVSGNIPPELNEFEMRTIKNHLGSWSRVTAGTDGFDMLENSPDTIELYMPKNAYEGMSYSDMDMQESYKKMQIMNTAFGSYAIFLEGDYPLEVYHTDIDNGKSICIIKESYGNAFSTWLINNYEYVYIADYRIFNGNGDNSNKFNVKDFYDLYHFDDLLILSYPYTIIADDLRQMLGQMWKSDYKSPVYTKFLDGDENSDNQISGVNDSSNSEPEDDDNKTDKVIESTNFDELTDDEIE